MKNSDKTEDLKRIIRSLLLSARHGLTVNELCSEYTAITCQALPYKEMGYFSAVDMMKDIPDVVKPVFLAGGTMLLRGIADSSTAHICQLVRNQKSVGRNTRITTPSQVKSPAQMVVPDIIRTRLKALISMYPKGLEIRQLESKYTHTHGRRLDFISIGFSSFSNFLERCSDIVIIKAVKSLQNKDTFVYPVSTNKSFLPTPKVIESKNMNKSSVPQSVKMEIHLLLSKFKIGLWASRFLFEYEVHFKKSLDIHRLGFNSTAELMSKIPELVHIHRPNEGGDWILQPVIPDEKLPSIVTNSDRIENCKAVVGDLIDVYISYIISPSSFWFQQTATVTELENLMEKMNTFYNSPQSNLYIPDKMSPGQVCCALYEDDQQWYRAVVKNIISKEKIQVYYVDYGNETTVNRSSVRYILEDYFKLPFQAFQGKLANIKPNNDLWSENAIKQFFVSTQDQELCAKVVKTGSFMLLDLTQTSSQINIAQTLSETGYGDRTPGKIEVDYSLSKKLSNGTIENLKNFYENYYETLKHVSAMSLAQTENKNVPVQTMDTAQVLQKEEIITNDTVKLFEPNYFIKTIKIDENTTLHVINYNQQPWVSSMDVSNLFWNVDILRQMIRQKGISLSKEIISSDSFELFSAIKKHNVRGQVNCDDNKSIITVYQLQELPKLFEVFKSRYENIQSLIEKEAAVSKKENYWMERGDEQKEEETNMLKLQALRFKKKRLYLSMITNTASLSAVEEIKAIEKEIACLQ